MRPRCGRRDQSVGRGGARAGPLPYRAAAILLAVAACARIEPPPGGPPDVTPPRLVSVRPESLASVPGFRGEVVFQFDEVVSEGGSANDGLGTGDLERLILLSPTVGVPEVRWHRTRIGVRPREGWKDGRVYRVQLLPGVTDLHNNRSLAERIVTFRTGGPAPETTLRGSVHDWVAGRPARGALVEAVLLPDSLTYRALADSNGAFVLGPLPKGEYLVYGVIDLSHNGRRDPRDQFDSVRVAPGATAVGELWTFPRDTIGPRLASVTVQDSVTLALAFSQPLDPRQRLDSTAARVRLLPDSTPVGVRTLLAPAAHDSQYQRPRARTDSGRGRVDSARAPAVPPAKTAADESRAALNDRLLLTLAAPVAAGAKYLVEVRGVRNVSGAAASPRLVLAVPAAPAAARRDSSVVRPDSLRGRLDSLKARADSAHPRKPT